MIHTYEGQYQYSKKIISDWNSSAIGVYYCGSITSENKLTPLYIGKGTGDGGMRSRLLEHIGKDYWPDVTHFGYQICDKISEADSYEAEEIAKYKPKYNKLGK